MQGVIIIGHLESIITSIGVIVALYSVITTHILENKRLKRDEIKENKTNEKIIDTIEKYTDTNKQVLEELVNIHDMESYKFTYNNKNATYRIKINHMDVEFNKPDSAKIYYFASIIESHKIEKHINQYEEIVNNLLFNYQEILNDESIELMTSQINSINTLKVFINKLNTKDIIENRTLLDHNDHVEYTKLKISDINHIKESINQITKISDQP